MNILIKKNNKLIFLNLDAINYKDINKQKLKYNLVISIWGTLKNKQDFILVLYVQLPHT